MSHLKTDWLCVATEGDTVDGRDIKRQWIIDMGETYDYNHYVALIWPEHENDCGNFGEVLEATWHDGDDGLARLYVSLCPNMRLIFANHEDQLLFFSIEPEENWRGSPDNQTPVYSAVPLPVPMAGNDSGMFQFPPEGTLVEVAFTGGRPDKPFIRQTLPDGTSLPDVKPGEQLQQQRAEVSQRVTQAGDWVRQTDQTISETSMARTVKADTEQRELVSRETMVKTTDKTTVLGTATLMAGAIQQVSAGDYSEAVKGNRLASIEGNDEADITGKQSTKVAGAVDVDVGGTLTEKIAALRKSVAAGGQQIMGPTVHIGSESVNTLTMMLDTIDLLAELAQQCASHSHPSVGTPTNAGAFTQTAAKAGQTRSKYQKIIA